MADRRLIDQLNWCQRILCLVGGTQRSTTAITKGMWMASGAPIALGQRVRAPESEVSLRCVEAVRSKQGAAGGKVLVDKDAPT